MTLQPLQEAVRKLDRKTPIGSKLRSREWELMPLALRERAQFSAGVESARFLAGLQEQLQGRASLLRQRVANGEAFIDRSSFIADLRGLAREEGIPVEEGKEGTLEDITSRRRLGLIYDMQTDAAAGYANWKANQDPDVLDASPAWLFERIESRDEPRQDWPQRWARAGDAVNWQGAVAAPMIALKNSPIWRVLSRFGTPWPPFDFGSGMGLTDVGRSEAEDIGLIDDTERLEPASADFNDELQASGRGIPPEIRKALSDVFGEQIDISGDTVRWKDQPHEPQMLFDLEHPAPAIRTATRQALDAAGRVHTLGDAKILPIDGEMYSDSNDGEYWSEAFVQGPQGRSRMHIGLQADSTNTALHEIGHFIDEQLLGKGEGQWASRSTEGAAFRRAVQATQAYADWASQPPGPWRDYLLDPKEWFARAYAQWVATEVKDRDPRVWEDFTSARREKPMWWDADFGDVAHEVGRLFAGKGWL